MPCNWDVVRLSLIGELNAVVDLVHQDATQWNSTDNTVVCQAFETWLGSISSVIRFPNPPLLVLLSDAGPRSILFSV